MKRSVIFHCNHMWANIGVSGVYQALIADIGEFGGDEIEAFGSDYKKYYRFRWSDDRSGIETEEVERGEITGVTLAVFSGFDPYRWMLPKVLRSWIGGAKIVFWCWGYHTKQQADGNWETGKVPLWVKRLAIFVKRHTLRPFVRFYLVSGESELDDSRLPPEKCVRMPMGRPQSAILDECDREQVAPGEFKDEALSYIGRGCWRSKGVGAMVEYASSPKGEHWKYRFFISSTEPGFEEKVEAAGDRNLEWRYDVFGKDNVGWLRRSAAFLTINLNPTQIRTPYEALYSGTPIVMNREGFMDGFKRILEPRGLGDAVQILDREEFDRRSFEVRTLEPDERKQLAEIMAVVLSAKEFGEWMCEWLADPIAPVSYYDHVAGKLPPGDGE